MKDSGELIFIFIRTFINIHRGKSSIITYKKTNISLLLAFCNFRIEVDLTLEAVLVMLLINVVAYKVNNV